MLQHFSQRLRNISDLNKTFRSLTSSGSAPMKLSELSHQKLLSKQQTTFMNFIVVSVNKKLWIYNLGIPHCILGCRFSIWMIQPVHVRQISIKLPYFRCLESHNEIHHRTERTIDWRVCVHWNIYILMLVRVSPQCYPLQEGTTLINPKGQWWWISVL